MSHIGRDSFCIISTYTLENCIIYSFLLQQVFECRTFTHKVFALWYFYFYLSKRSEYNHHPYHMKQSTSQLTLLIYKIDRKTTVLVVG